MCGNNPSDYKMAALAKQAIPEKLLAGLSRFQIAYDTGLERDIEPLTREAVQEGLALLKDKPHMQFVVTNNFEELMRALDFLYQGSVSSNGRYTRPTYAEQTIRTWLSTNGQTMATSRV